MNEDERRYCRQWKYKGKCVRRICCEYCERQCNIRCFTWEKEQCTERKNLWEMLLDLQLRRKDTVIYGGYLDVIRGYVVNTARENATLSASFGGMGSVPHK